MKWLKGFAAAVLVCMPALAGARECPEPEAKYDVQSPEGIYRCLESKDSIGCYRTKDAHGAGIKPILVLRHRKNCSDTIIVMETVKFRDGGYEGMAINNKLVLYPTNIFSREEGEKLMVAFSRIWRNMDDGTFFFEKRTVPAERTDMTYLFLYGPDEFFRGQTGKTVDDAIENLVHLIGEENSELVKIRFSP